MNLLTILDMTASALGDRQALGEGRAGPAYADLRRQAGTGGAYLRKEATGTVFIGRSGHALSAPSSPATGGRRGDSWWRGGSGSPAGPDLPLGPNSSVVHLSGLLRFARR